MTILDAIAAMRAGKRVQRSCHIGTTVARCWLAIESEMNEESREIEDVIYFYAEAITKEHYWIGEYPGLKNPWAPRQSDLFADDWTILD